MRQNQIEGRSSASRKVRVLTAEGNADSSEPTGKAGQDDSLAKNLPVTINLQSVYYLSSKTHQGSIDTPTAA